VISLKNLTKNICGVGCSGATLGQTMPVPGS